MSYKRKYSETITVRGSKTVSVSYPASQSGGTKMVSVDYVERVPVDVNIHVDTNPFEHSVGKHNNKVNLLTGAIVATESAQVVSKNNSSRKIADTIISGFFGIIRSEISQQVNELAQKIDSELMHLRELSKSCLAKKDQMHNDYQRITSRYSKIFEDLNQELKNRVHELDKPTFFFKNEMENQNSRMMHTDLANTVSVFGSENSDLQTKISTSVAKKRAFDTLLKSKIFLNQQKKLNDTLHRSLLNENLQNRKYLSVCFLNVKDDKNENQNQYFVPNELKEFESEIQSDIQGLNIQTQKIDTESADQINIYFQNKCENYFQQNNTPERVKQMIQKLADINNLIVYP